MKRCFACGLSNVDSNQRCLDCGQPLPAFPTDTALPTPVDTSAVSSPAPGYALLARILTEPRIRIYVETGSNKGHQSSSVTLARKLLERAPAKNRHPKLVIEFLCNDDDAAGKVRSILGGPTIGGVAAEVTTFGWLSPSKVNFAFSGAVDDPLATYRRINTACFIGLQPYGWPGGAEISLAGDKMVVLAKGSQLMGPAITDKVAFPLAFNRLPFTEQDAGASEWVPTAPADLAVKCCLDYGRNALRHRVASLQDSPRVYICPLYGMGAGQPMEGLGARIWINVGAALLRIARTRGLPGGVLLLNVSKDLGSDMAMWPKVKAHFAGSTGVKVFDKLVTFNAVDDVFEAFEQGTKLCICTIGGDKDQRTMDRVYRECPLPPIFEGQGSLTQVLPMGRPFIKYSARAAVDKNWRSDYLPVPGYEDVIAEMQVVCNAIGDDLSVPKPKVPLDRLCGLFLQMFDTQSILANYFSECRAVATCPKFDRLAWACEALARIDSENAGVPIPEKK